MSFLNIFLEFIKMKIIKNSFIWNEAFQSNDLINIPISKLSIDRIQAAGIIAHFGYSKGNKKKSRAFKSIPVRFCFIGFQNVT